MSGTEFRPDGDLLQGVGSRAGDRSDRRERRRNRRVLITALSIVVALVVGGVVTLQVVQGRLDGNVERIEDPFAGLTDRPVAPDQDEPVAERALNVLVLGSDSRISAGDPSQWEAGAARTDTMMLVHLPADRGAAYAMSIPRDSWVEIPGRGSAKINAAFAFGGPALAVATVEELTGVRVDHVAMTDFESFQAVTDSLGGVRMTLREDLVDRGRLVLPAGEQVLSGEEALTYVRQRKNLGRGDFDRVQRQQAWMRAIVARVRNEGTLRNPVAAYGFLDTVSQSVAVDEGMTRDVMMDLLDRARVLGSSDIVFFTVPITGTGWSADGQSIVELDRPAFDELMRHVREDRVEEFLADRPDAVDVLPAVAP